jgi:tape measure domain-containing protein
MSEGNVQLKLQVGFDLVAFRKDLGKLANVAQSEFTASLNLKFNRATLDAELNNVQRAISRRVFRAELTTNFEAEIAYADTLERKLKNLSAQRVKNLASVAATGQAGGFIDESKFNAYLNRLTKTPLEAVRNALQSAGVQMKSAGKNTTEELRQSILSGLPQVTEDIGRGLIKGLNPEMKESGRKGAQSLIDGFKKATGIASPSRVFKQLGKFSADGLEIGFFNGLRSFGVRSVAEIRRIAALMRLELASIGNVPIAASLPRAGRTRGSRQYFNPIGPLPRGSSDPWAWNQEAFRHEPRLAQPGQARGAGVRPMQSRFPFASMPPVMGTTTAPSMFGVSRPALPSVSSAATNREASLEARQLEARARSDARAAIVLAEDAARATARARLQTVSGQVPLGGMPAGVRGFLPGSRERGGGGEGGAFVSPRKFPSDGMMGPATAIGPGSAMAQWKVALKGAEEAMSGFQTNSIPFIGGLKSIAMELGQATKQVLLYGTAYKGLAFITSLPGQIFNAVKAQQQYNNSLQVVTEGTGTYAKELLYVDQIQRTFGLDLEATRKGFTDLYASMAPTGFDSGSIEKLFTGISAASAALQLTPATMDRVIYAFAQMASKGQIMSEELKRQLGDALPGALGIFANAAGMSLQEFNKAMEAGEFTGAKFRETIAKVTDELIKRFGTGAQAAGQSLQGLTNTIKGDFIRTLESLAPVVDSVAQATLIPLSRVLKQFSSAASIAMGEMERLQNQIGKQKELLGELRVSGVDEKEIKKAEVALLALQSQYDQLKIALDDPAVKQQSENIKAFVKELQQLGTIVLNISQAIGSVLNPILTFFGTNLSQAAVVITSVILGFNAMKLSVAVAAFAMTVWNKVVLASAAGAAAKAAQVKLLKMAFQVLGAKVSIATLSTVKFGIALKALLVSTGIGAVVVGLGLLAAGFASVGNSARKAAEDAKASIQSIREAAASGNVALIEMKETEAKVNVAGIDAALKELDTAETRRRGRGGQRVTTVTESQAAGYRALGVAIEPGNRPVEALKKNLQAARQAQAQVLQGVAAEKPVAEARRKALGLESPQPGEFPDEGGDGQAADDAAREAEKRQRELERLQNQQQQMILANAELQAKLQEIEFNEGKDIAEEKFSFIRRLIDAEYDYRLSKANEIQAVQLRLEKQLSDSRLSALESVENALMRIEEARFRSKIAGQKVEAAKQFDALQEQQPSAVPGALPGAPDAPVLPLPSGGVGEHKTEPTYIGSVESLLAAIIGFQSRREQSGHTAHGSGMTGADEHDDSIQRVN